MAKFLTQKELEAALEDIAEELDSEKGKLFTNFLSRIHFSPYL